MFKRFLIFCYFLTFCTFAENQRLLDLPITDQNFGLNGYEIQNIKSFDIIDFNSEKGLVIYHTVYGLWDVAGEEDEDGQVNKTPPLIDCHYKDQNLGAKASSEWGIIDLEKAKAVDVVIVRKPSRSKSSCTTEKEARKNWKTFEEKVKSLGLNLNSAIPIKSAKEIAKDLHTERAKGMQALKTYQSLSEKQKKSIFGVIDLNLEDSEDLTYFQKEKNWFQDKMLRMLTLKNNKEIIWTFEFSDMAGAMASSSDYKFKGFVGDKDKFFILIDQTAKAGAHAYEHDLDRVLISPMLKI